MCGLLGLLYAFWHGTEVGVSVLRSFQIVQLVLGYAYTLPNLDLEYNFQKKRTLTLKSLLKCLNVDMRSFVLIFFINTVFPLDPSSFFQGCPICCQNSIQQTLWPHFCLPSFGLWCARGSCAQPRSLFCWAVFGSSGLRGNGATKKSPGLDCQDNSCSRMFKLSALPSLWVPWRHLYLHPYIACPINLNMLVN